MIILTLSLETNLDGKMRQFISKIDIQIYEIQSTGLEFFKKKLFLPIIA